MASQKIENIQAMRGIAVLSVAIYHIWIFENLFWNTDKVLPKIFSLGHIGVDLFFVISGFVIVSVTRGLFSQYASIKTFIFKRITRIFPLYWFYTILLLAAYCIIGTDFGKLAANYRSFLLLPQSKLPVLDIGWSLIHEMHFYFIFALLMFLNEKHLIKVLILWAVLVTAGNIFFESFALGWNLYYLKLSIDPLTIEFILGCIVAKLTYNNHKINPEIIFISGLILLTICGTIYSNIDYNRWARTLLFGFPFAMIIYGSVTMEKSKSIVFPSLLRKVGDASYSIYLSHTIIIMAVGRIWRLNNFDGFVDNIIFSIIMLILIVGFGFFSYRFVERPILVFFRKITTAQG